MNKITSAAHGAGAWPSHVQTSTADFAPVPRRVVMSTVKRLRADLGLSTGDILVLDSLLSFLPCRDRQTGADKPITPDTMLIIYASNASLSARANGMDERVLRRHLARLSDRGLIRRRNSATGKRFPLRSGGRITSAYGLDVTPLLEQHSNLARRAEELALSAEEARTLRSMALTIRAELCRIVDRLPENTRDFIIRSKTVLRRSSLTLSQISDILAELTHIANGQGHHAEVTAPPTPTTETPTPSRPETDNESGTDGETVRLVESPKIDTNPLHKRKPQTRLHDWSAFSNLAEYFPDPPKTPRELSRVLYTVGSMIRLQPTSVASGIARIGWRQMLRAVDYLIGNADRIANTDAYLRKVIENGLQPDTAREKL